MDKVIPLTVLIPVRNEQNNLTKCLAAIVDWADEIVVVDSQSTDATVEIAKTYGAQVLQFYYEGGWPKKRQWAMENYKWKNDWILLLDADEVLLPEIRDEISDAIHNIEYDGYWIRFRIYFLGRLLKFGGTDLWKLCLFRTEKGRYEKRLTEQDKSMADIEIHEHVVIDGKAGHLKNPIRHENFNLLDRYISKHNEYSNWEAKLIITGSGGEVAPRFFGTQAERRRWLKKRIILVPGSPILLFLYCYIIKLGFMDGLPGFNYAVFRGVQWFHIKVKIYEMQRQAAENNMQLENKE